jgi:hypothetical protein
LVNLGNFSKLLILTDDFFFEIVFFWEFLHFYELGCTFKLPLLPTFSTFHVYFELLFPQTFFLKFLLPFYKIYFFRRTRVFGGGAGEKVGFGSGIEVQGPEKGLGPEIVFHIFLFRDIEKIQILRKVSISSSRDNV